MNAKQRALVTGGTGFIGSNLARRLVQKGWDVHLIIRPDSKLDIIQDISQKLTCHVFNGSNADMSEIVKRAQPSIVFHLASYFRAQHITEDIEPMLNSNLIFSVQLLEAMAKDGVRLIVNTGTAWQHYEGKEYSPVCLYAATKQAFETMMQFYIEAQGLSAITLKLTDTYGPNDPRPKLLYQVRKAAAEGTKLQMSPGGQYVDFVHIDDVIEAYFIAADMLLKGTVSGHKKYWVSKGKQQPLRKFVEETLQNENLKADMNWGGREYRSREMMEIFPVHPIIFDSANK